MHRSKKFHHAQLQQQSNSQSDQARPASDPAGPAKTRVRAPASGRPDQVHLRLLVQGAPQQYSQVLSAMRHADQLPGGIGR